MLERGLLLLFDRILEVTNGLGTLDFKNKDLVRTIALDPTNKLEFSRHGGPGENTELRKANRSCDRTLIAR